MQGIQGAQGLHTACGIHARDGDLRPHTCHRAWQSIVLIAPLAELEHRAVLHQGCQRPRGRGLADLQALLQLRTAQRLALLAQHGQHGLHQLRSGVGHGDLQIG